MQPRRRKVPVRSFVSAKQPFHRMRTEGGKEWDQIIAVTPAPEGFHALEVMMDTDNRPVEYTRQPVIAFAIGRRSQWPITPTMSMFNHPKQVHALEYPDGRVEHWTEIFESVQAWWDDLLWISQVDQKRVCH
jgi:hypothetical protein